MCGLPQDAYPLLRIDGSLDIQGRAKYFSTMDLASAYDKVEVNPVDCHQTTFTTPFGLFEYNWMPCSLAGAPGLFQKLMQTFFRDEVLQILIVYLDDIIVFSQDIPDHLRRLEIILKKLWEHGLKLKPKKCQFFCPNVNCLGHVISANGVTTDPDKTEVVKNWPRPRTLKDLSLFWSFVLVVVLCYFVNKLVNCTLISVIAMLILLSYSLAYLLPMNTGST